MNVNYDAISETYDTYRHGEGPYLPILLREAHQIGAATICEIGAGTGNVADAFLQHYACTYIGVEASTGMIAKARRKHLPGFLVQGDALALPIAKASIGFLFGCYVLHHIQDLAACLNECARVLQPDGELAIVTAPHDFIRGHPLNRYFPDFAAIDCARFPTLARVESGMKQAGLREVRTERCAGVPQPIDAQYVEKVALKFISTFALMDPGRFERGLEHLRAEVAAKGVLETPIVWQAAVISGRKPV